MASMTEAEEIIIDPEGDLNIELVTSFGNGEDRRTNSRAIMKVKRSVLEESSAFFKTMLAGPFKGSRENVVQLEDRNTAVIELWFRVLHAKMVGSFYTSQKIDIENVWIAIETGRQYLLEIEKLEPWFDRWLQENSGGKDLPKFRDTYDLRALLYPCHELDCAWGFAAATKKLAYEYKGHVTEFNPTNFRRLHLPNRLIGGINGAKGNLRTKLHEGIYLQGDFLDSDCDCRVQGLYNFEEALHDTGVWPLESTMSGRGKKSISEVLAALRSFDYTAPASDIGHHQCSESHVEESIHEAIRKVASNFDGLCLDCIDRLKTGDIDNDYWRHAERGRKWDKDCRINHGQPTWYFSWVARKHVQDAHEKEREERKRKKAEMAMKERVSRRH
ncbi:hypothetical protein F5884DRAFT_297420 [Xylogone sp. PMI_703]|nr:hypothetical protein F5884DRAFT_297420 [Xylogone sp. PMI_703]